MTLRIPRQALPRRYYTSNNAFWVRYFALKLPIYIGPETVTFVYVDPGYHTDRNLRAWGSSHAPLWRALRRKGSRIRVVAVARDETRLKRSNKVLKRWTQGHCPKGQQPLTPDEEQEIEEIRLAFFRRDRTALDRWGGPQAALFHQRDLKRRPAFEDTESGLTMRALGNPGGCRSRDQLLEILGRQSLRSSDFLANLQDPCLFTGG